MIRVRPDLATRLRQSQRALKSRLAKPDAQLTLIRAAHQTLEPPRIGELIVEHAAEFALILPDTGSEGAAAVAERVRERLAMHTFLQRDGLAVRLTVSIGVATLPDVAGSAEDLVQAADTATYRVKESGKDGVFVAIGIAAD